MRSVLKYISCVLILCMILLCFPSFEEKEIKEEREFITESLFAFSPKIDVEKFDINKSELSGLITEILKDEPYLFFVRSSMGYEARSDGRVLALYPVYTMSEEEFVSAKNFCDTEISRALTLVENVNDELRKAIIMHDYLCINYAYDDTLISDNMYSFLKEGKGTCQGYTYTYMAILRALGIRSTFAASDSMSHIWNLVNINGEWYHTDVTWDDKDGFSFVYRNFMNSDEEMINTLHADWYSYDNIKCTSNIYKEEIISPLLLYSSSGDVNCDGDIDVLDLVLCSSYKKRSPTNHAFLLSSADIDGDIRYTENDIELLKKIIFD